MLSSLHIENIAVIERADIEFGGGFNVLTGETGAGKSIVVDALGAVLGGRTSRELVRTGAEKALVSAVFTGDEAAWWCKDNEIEPEEELIIQRRVAADGKSSCRVNGLPVTVQQLRSLGALLLDIHGQNDGRQLLDETRHLNYLDRFGGHDNVLAAFEEKYAAFRETKREIDRLSMDDAEKERQIESLTAQIAEIEGAEITVGEEAELTARRELMKHAGKLTEALAEAYGALYENDENAVGLVSEAQAHAGRASAWAPELSETEGILREARYMLEDAAEHIGDLRRTLDFSPEEYDRIETRLSRLKRLERKYKTGEEGLLAHLDSCRERLGEIEYAGDRLVKLEQEMEGRRREAKAAASALTKARESAAERLQKRIISELKYLSMPSVRFVVSIEPVANADGFAAGGGDEVRFLMSANTGEAPGRIAKIASGGELSRIMLAMKSVFAEKDAVPSLVFDEIDTGVSGVAAQRVGEKMAALSKYKQVLCITHLPQIAALADTHFSISKSERGGRAYTEVTDLDRAGRVSELARLHGGDVVTELSLQSAEEQLAAAEEYKRNI